MSTWALFVGKGVKTGILCFKNSEKEPELTVLPWQQHNMNQYVSFFKYNTHTKFLHKHSWRFSSFCDLSSNMMSPVF